MNAETVLKVWMDENVSVGAIARLFETDMVSVEDGIRKELRRLRSEAMEAEPKDETRAVLNSALLRPIDTDEIKRHRDFQKRESAKQMTRGGHGSPDAETCKHPRRQKRIAKPAAKPAADVSDLESYPEPLRYPLAVNLRAIWRALSEPRTALQIAEETGIASDTVYNALFTMKTKLVVHKRDADGKWERINEVPR